MRGEQQRAGDREAEHAVDADHRQPLLLLQRERLAEPPGVDEQVAPSRPPARISTSRTKPSTNGVAEQPEHERAEHQSRATNSSATVPISPNQIRSAIRPTCLRPATSWAEPGQHEGHQHQRHGAPELRHRGRAGVAVGGAGEAADCMARQYHQSHASRGEARRGVEDVPARCSAQYHQSDSRSRPPEPATPAVSGQPGPRGRHRSIATKTRYAERRARSVPPGSTAG